MTKLVRQIREALAANGSGAPVESLATEYTRLCEEANQRLETCAAMLAKGSEYQALQLAETEPALLDVIGILSFAEVPEWVAFCGANQLPFPAKFDSKAVQALDGVYSKGISANHPLYKDYRGAVTSRNDARALQIIRSIVRLNADDGNAKSELVRIENKLFQLKLQELREALAQRDEHAILCAGSELERLAPASRLEEFPEFGRAMDVRKEVARREAIARAEGLVESLDEEREAGSWRMVGDLLARLRSLQGEHGFQLSSGAAAQCAEMQQFFDAHRAAADETARFEQALAALGLIAGRVDSRMLTGSALSLGDAQSFSGELKRRWNEVEVFQRTVPEDLVRRVRASAGGVQAEIDRLQRQRRVKLISLSAGALAVVAIAAWFTLRALKAQDVATQLAKLQGDGQVEAAEKLIAQVRTEDRALAAKPRLGSRLEEIDGWAREQHGALATIEGRLKELETATGSGVEQADPIALATKLESTNQLIGTLAVGLRAAPTGRMLVVRNQFEAHITVLREKLSTQAESELTKLENLANTKLAYDQPKEVIVPALAEIETVLKPLETRLKSSVAGLDLPASEQARVVALRKRADLFHEEIGTLADIHESLLQVTTADAYLEALQGYKRSRLAQAREVLDARKLLAVPPKSDALLASLLLPGDPAGWAAVKTDVTADAFSPDTVLPAEIGKLVALRDDAYLNDIWEITFADVARRNERRDLYSRGDLRKEGPTEISGAQTTRWVGAIYDPRVKSEVPGFTPTTYTFTRATYGMSGDGEVTARKLSGTSESLNRMELNRMTDSTGSKFERPLLRVFELLVRDKSASPLFKAYLMQQLGAVLEIRPYAWGLEYSENLRTDLDQLGSLLDQGSLRSQDWLLERKKTQFNSRLSAFFETLQKRSYFAEARLHREVVRGAMAAGLQFGGFIDSTGQGHLLGEALNFKSLWMLSSDSQSLVPYRPADAKKQADTQDAVGFSPVYFVPLDQNAFLGDIQRKLERQFGTKLATPSIPWLSTL